MLSELVILGLLAIAVAMSDILEDVDVDTDTAEEVDTVEEVDAGEGEDVVKEVESDAPYTVL